MNSAKEPVVCTIIAKNYIAQARTLCQSFLEWHPGGRCYVLIVDDYRGYVDPAAEKFEIVNVDDLELAGFNEMTFKYSALELCTAVKPSLLRHLLSAKGLEKVLYLDPDILVTNSLCDLYNKLDQTDIILIPHTTQYYPEDGRQPDDSRILMYGIFNLGFIGVRKSDTTDIFLLWWKKELDNKCVADFSKGYFLDQKFIDFVPVYFDNYSVIKSDGYNVAYWNLHHQSISYSHADDLWQCNGGKLYFYHFSGFQPEYPDRMSVGQSRFELNEMPDVKRLFDHYRQLLSQNGYELSQQWGYTYNSFANGKKIGSNMRIFYRKMSTVDRRHISDPFNERGFFVYRMRLLRLKKIRDMIKKFVRNCCNLFYLLDKDL